MEEKFTFMALINNFPRLSSSFSLFVSHFSFNFLFQHRHRPNCSFCMEILLVSLLLSSPASDNVRLWSSVMLFYLEQSILASRDSHEELFLTFYWSIITLVDAEHTALQIERCHVKYLCLFSPFIRFAVVDKLQNINLGCSINHRQACTFMRCQSNVEYFNRKVQEFTSNYFRGSTFELAVSTFNAFVEKGTRERERASSTKAFSVMTRNISGKLLMSHELNYLWSGKDCLVRPFRATTIDSATVLNVFWELSSRHTTRYNQNTSRCEWCSIKASSRSLGRFNLISTSS